MVEYYIAQKSCSRGIHKRVLLSVEGEKVNFYKGIVNDGFEINSERKLSAVEKSDNLLSYSFYGPLTKEELEQTSDLDFGDFTTRNERRLHSKLPIKL